MTTNKAEVLRSLIAGSNGTIFTIGYIKKSGQFRKMNCRLGVSKGVKGIQTNRRERDIDNNLLTVYDVQAEAFRCVTLNTVQFIKIRNQTISVF